MDSLWSVRDIVALVLAVEFFMKEEETFFQYQTLVKEICQDKLR